MYRRPKFLEVLLDIRQEMARVADYDVDLFAEMVRSGKGFDGALAYHLIDPVVENGIPASRKVSTKKARKAVRK